MVQLGQTVENFASLAYHNGQFKKVQLKDFKGKWIVLFFYPRDFTFICPTEIRGFATREQDFTKMNTVLLGASTDSEHSHKAWFERDLQEVKFPILADTNHAISRYFHVLKEDEGLAHRGTFIIDPQGVLRYQVVSDINVGRSVDETLRVLQGLQTGELCPVEWEPGQKTLGK